MKRMNGSYVSSLLVGSIVCLAGFGCTTDTSAVDARRPGQRVEGKFAPRKVVAHGAKIFPDESLTDWISYSDQVSVVTVIRDEEAQPDPSVLENGEGYVGRKVTLRIEDTLWTRPGSDTQSGQIEMLALGWVIHENQRSLVSVHDTPRIVVGGRYILPLLRISGAWTTLTPGSAIAADEDPVATADISENGQAVAARNISHIDSAAIGRLLASSRPDPEAEKYRDLPPIERVRMVHRIDPRDAPPRPRGLPAEVAHRIAPAHLVQAVIDGSK